MFRSDVHSPLYLGTVALIVSWVMTSLTGCRFRNAVEYPQQSQTGIELVGVFVTEPQGLTICQKKLDNTQTCSNFTKASTPDLPNRIPYLASGIFTPQILVARDRAQPQLGYVFSSDQSKGLALFFDTATDLIVSTGDLIESSFWPTQSSMGCQVALSVDGSGTLTFESARPDKSDGTAQFDLRFLFRFNNTAPNGCQNMFTQIKNCYLDQNQCGGANGTDNATLYLTAHDRMEDYVLNGTITPSDFPQTQELFYTVSY